MTELKQFSQVKMLCEAGETLFCLLLLPSNLKQGQIQLNVSNTTLSNSSVLGICEESSQVPQRFFPAIISALVSFIDQMTQKNVSHLLKIVNLCGSTQCFGISGFVSQQAAVSRTRLSSERTALSL